MLMIPGWAIWIAGVAAFMLIGKLFAMMRATRRAHEATERMAFTARFQRGRADAAEARCTELDCRLRHVLDLHVARQDQPN
jgi:hypothetical protein